MRRLLSRALAVPFLLTGFVFVACVGDEPASSSGGDGGGGDAIASGDSSGSDGSSGGDAISDAKRPAPSATGKFDWAIDWPMQSIPGAAIAYDAAGNLWMAVSFYGTMTLDATHALTSNGGSEDFALVKVDSGGHIMSATQFGTTANEEAAGIACDGTDVYVSGSFNGTSVDFGGGITVTRAASVTEIEPFVVKFSGGDGSAKWADNFATPSASGAYGSCNQLTAGGGSVGVVCSASRALAFKLTSGSTKTPDYVDPVNMVDDNSFVAQLDSSTGLARWATLIGGDSQTFVQSQANDSTGAMAVTIYSFGTTVRDPASSLSITNTRGKGNPAMFVAKLAAADGTGAWGVEFTTGSMTPTLETSPGGVAFTSTNDVIIGGEVQGTSIPIGGKSISSHGGLDAFVAKLLGTNGSTVWATPFGGSGDEQEAWVAVDAWDEIFFAGRYASANYTIGTTSLPAPNATSVAVEQAKLDSSGNPFWAFGLAAEADASNENVYLASNLSLATTSSTGAMAICGYIPSQTTIDIGNGPINTGSSEYMFLLQRSP